MVMRKPCSSLILHGVTAVLIVACAVPAATETISTTPSNTAPAAVSDQSGMLRATGQGAMPSATEEPNRARAYLKAKSYAKMDAIANLVQAARGTAIKYRSTGRGYISEEEISQEIDGVVDSVQIVSERKQQEGKDTIVEVTVQSPLPFADRQEALGAGPNSPGVQIASAAHDASWIASAGPKVDRGMPVARAKEAAYTSVIINAVGLSVKRSMAPKILRSDESEVWGTVKLDYDFVEDHGIVAYVRSVAEAFGNARSGENPLVIRALARGSSPYKGDVIISDEDAAYLLAESKRSNFLGEFRVIFVIDPSPY